VSTNFQEIKPLISLSGTSLIGSRRGSENEGAFRALAPATGAELEPLFYSASSEEIDRAGTLAAQAFETFGRSKPGTRADFLRLIAQRIESAQEQLIERANSESALPLARLRGEIARTCGQLRLFAQTVEEGSWTAPRIDHGDPSRKPLPKPDVRSMLRPLGPVVVFGASNFPFAFSVAGGDTASAFAAGNPVIVKAHPAHPGTSELVALVIRDSVAECGFSEGVFSLLFDSGVRVGTELVQHKLVKAAAFTGSLAAGRALFSLAVSRPEPIPFYGEMSSTNPLFVLPEALAGFAERIAGDLFGSFTLGGGQFCTKPGLVFLSEGKTADQFKALLQSKVKETAPFVLLTKGIGRSYGKELRVREEKTGLHTLAKGTAASEAPETSAVATLFETDVASFLRETHLAEEHFGPSTLLVAYKEKQEILDCTRSLGGQLTATVHATADDLREYAELIRILETKVGRIIFNGYPTGVEVCRAMIHGGPYPATTDSRTTSVGALAINRFARPVCYQDCPQSALPCELQDDNPSGIWRLVDGEFTNRKTC
jgi:alpha-ketoglutaric semialdehyde dehydrogenase